jgi:hypothetical protein
MSASTVLVYGAAGYTGRLIVERARARGLRPILAGRGHEQITSMATAFGLDCRIVALETVEGWHLTVTTLASQLAQPVEANTDSVFAFLDNLLAPESTPKSWLQDGLASWIQCFKAQADLYQGICATVCDSSAVPSGNGSPPVLVRPGDNLRIALDQFAEATDPYVIDIPVATPGAVKPTIDRIKGAGVKALFPENIDLSVSSDGKAILVALARLKTKLSPNNPDGTYYSAGGTYGASLTWSKDVTISISATISATIG